jgi:hypothetical protein
VIDWRNLACASNPANLTAFQASARAPRSRSIQTTIQELEQLVIKKLVVNSWFDLPTSSPSHLRRGASCLKTDTLSAAFERADFD